MDYGNDILQLELLIDTIKYRKGHLTHETPVSERAIGLLENTVSEIEYIIAKYGQGLKHDRFIEKLWDELSNVLFDDDNPEERDMVLLDDWRWFPAGTEREEIWHWFDEHYSKGVAALLGFA